MPSRPAAHRKFASESAREVPLVRRIVDLTLRVRSTIKARLGSAGLLPDLVTLQIALNVFVHVSRVEAVHLHFRHRAFARPALELHAVNRAHGSGAVNPGEAVNQ